jgi:hypothetical protein
MLRDLNLCAGKQRGYRALMGGMFRRVLGLSLACAAVLVVPSPAAAAPTGIVTGWRDPVEGSMKLTVTAMPDRVTNVALHSATWTLGTLGDTALFEDGSCSSTCPPTVDLPVDTAKKTQDERLILPDGLHTLVVTIRDQNGETAEILRKVILVDNVKPASPCKEEDPPLPPGTTPLACVVEVAIGSGALAPQPSPGGGGSVGGESGPVCASPRLSMGLASKPLRYRRGVPVLAAGRAYRYAGTLTCRINGRRRPALRGTEVQVRNRLRGWTISKPSITLRKAGDVVARLSYRSSRVVIFRVRAAGGEVVRVRIPIRVVSVKKGRR